jgi:hypothetical protein
LRPRLPCGCQNKRADVKIREDATQFMYVGLYDGATPLIAALIAYLVRLDEQTDNHGDGWRRPTASQHALSTRRAISVNTPKDGSIVWWQVFRAARSKSTVIRGINSESHVHHNLIPRRIRTSHYSIHVIIQLYSTAGIGVHMRNQFACYTQHNVYTCLSRVRLLSVDIRGTLRLFTPHTITSARVHAGAGVYNTSSLHKASYCHISVSRNHSVS